MWQGMSDEVVLIDAVARAPLSAFNTYRLAAPANYKHGAFLWLEIDTVHPAVVNELLAEFDREVQLLEVCTVLPEYLQNPQNIFPDPTLSSSDWYNEHVPQYYDDDPLTGEPRYRPQPWPVYREGGRVTLLGDDDRYFRATCLYNTRLDLTPKDISEHVYLLELEIELIGESADISVQVWHDTSVRPTSVKRGVEPVPGTQVLYFPIMLPPLDAPDSTAVYKHSVSVFMRAPEGTKCRIHALRFYRWLKRVALDPQMRRKFLVTLPASAGNVFWLGLVVPGYEEHEQGLVYRVGIKRLDIRYCEYEPEGLVETREVPQFERPITSASVVVDGENLSTSDLEVGNSESFRYSVVLPADETQSVTFVPVFGQAGNPDGNTIYVPVQFRTEVFDGGDSFMLQDVPYCSAEMVRAMISTIGRYDPNLDLATASLEDLQALAGENLDRLVRPFSITGAALSVVRLSGGSEVEQNLGAAQTIVDAGTEFWYREQTLSTTGVFDVESDLRILSTQHISDNALGMMYPSSPVRFFNELYWFRRPESDTMDEHFAGVIPGHMVGFYPRIPGRIVPMWKLTAAAPFGTLATPRVPMIQGAYGLWPDWSDPYYCGMLIQPGGRFVGRARASTIPTSTTEQEFDFDVEVDSDLPSAQTLMLVTTRRSNTASGIHNPINMHHLNFVPAHFFRATYQLNVRMRFYGMYYPTWSNPRLEQRPGIKFKTNFALRDGSGNDLVSWGTVQPMDPTEVDAINGAYFPVEFGVTSSDIDLSSLTKTQVSFVDLQTVVAHDTGYPLGSLSNSCVAILSIRHAQLLVKGSTVSTSGNSLEVTFGRLNQDDPDALVRSVAMIPRDDIAPTSTNAKLIIQNLRVENVLRETGDAVWLTVVTVYGDTTQDECVQTIDLTQVPGADVTFYGSYADVEVPLLEVYVNAGGESAMRPINHIRFMVIRGNYQQPTRVRIGLPVRFRDSYTAPYQYRWLALKASTDLQRLSGAFTLTIPVLLRGFAQGVGVKVVLRGVAGSTAHSMELTSAGGAVVLQDPGPPAGGQPRQALLTIFVTSNPFTRIDGLDVYVELPSTLSSDTVYGLGLATTGRCILTLGAYVPVRVWLTMEDGVFVPDTIGKLAVYGSRRVDTERLEPASDVLVEEYTAAVLEGRASRTLEYNRRMYMTAFRPITVREGKPQVRVWLYDRNTGTEIRELAASEFDVDPTRGLVQPRWDIKDDEYLVASYSFEVLNEGQLLQYRLRIRSAPITRNRTDYLTGAEPQLQPFEFGAKHSTPFEYFHRGVELQLVEPAPYERGAVRVGYWYLPVRPAVKLRLRMTPAGPPVVRQIYVKV